MAMSGDVLGASILAAIAGLDPASKANPAAVWRAIGDTIVAYIQTNATIVVPAGIPVGTSGGAGATTAPVLASIT